MIHRPNGPGWGSPGETGRAPVPTLLAEGARFQREALTEVLRDLPGIRWEGAVADGAEALDWCRRIPFGLLVLNPWIPGLSGLHLAGRIAREGWPVRVVAVADRSDPNLLHRAETGGWAALVDLSEEGPAAVREAVRQAGTGGGYLSPGVRQAQARHKADPLAFDKILSAREQEVLALIAAGWGEGRIAARLGLRPASVQTHRRNLLRKLDLHSTASLMARGQELGFWRPSFAGLGLEPPIQPYG